MLNDFIAWQWELAIAASRLSLDLLSDNEIIAFTHKLMDNGYYNDIMLEIIDNDPLFPEITIKKNFGMLGRILNFPDLSMKKSLYLNTFWRIFPFTQHPFDFDYFLILAKFSQFYSYFQDIFNDQYSENNCYIDIEDLIYNLYRLDDDLAFYENKMIGLGEVLSTYFEFLQDCDSWVNQHQPKILEIMNQIFPQH